MCAIYFMGPRIFEKLEKRGGALGQFMDQVDEDAAEELRERINQVEGGEQRIGLRSNRSFLLL